MSQGGLTGWSNTNLQGPTLHFSGEEKENEGEEEEGETESTQENTRN